MIKNINISPEAKEFDKLCERPKKEQVSLNKVIAEIFEKVAQGGDDSLKKFTKLYDRVDVNFLAVTQEEIIRAKEIVDIELQEAIKVAETNIYKFHKAQLPSDIRIEVQEGVVCSQRAIPIERVGLYIPCLLYTSPSPRD